MKKLFLTHLLMLMLFFPTALTAQNIRKFIIIDLYNCKSILIGQKKMKKNDVFDGRETIHWTNVRQLMLFQELIGGKKVGPIYKKTGYEFEKQEVKSIIELLTKEKSTGHRSASQDEEHYTHSYHYLADSLHIPTRNSAEDNDVAEAYWELNNKKIVTTITRTSDGKFYIITPAIYKQQTPRDVKLFIRERDTQNNFTHNIYNEYPIIYIPKKLKK